ncbi:sensor histidine kinase [Myceligenerans pegani]|uniref:histidine kinase n=1 Tax=Myceligenerans pegani TaxID=2776917 RepID=A0ABR9MS54_9MICO|nr:histidine kinase [Myceligenerans sp. TRM 65318]MBE1874202.1 hypothetical protein [Myceligenerans sp. TRM 65318]MBE3016474.1 hypothetical protein [Myceligenerans sp. TRM 65318]
MTTRRVYADVVSVRRALLVVLAVLTVVSAWLLGNGVGPVGVPAAVAVGAVLAMIVGGRAGRSYLHVLAIGAGSISLATTAYVLFADVTIGEPGKHPGPVELIALFALLAAVVRWTAPLRVAVISAALVWVAFVVWVLRLVKYWPQVASDVGPWPISSGFDLLIILGHLAGMAFPATIAVLTGGVPRHLARRRRELIAEVRREQRLELAQDLHDFVAHDLTGIVAQAQAVRFARADDLDQMREVLERIEHVGVGALDAMDGFVQVLHDDGAAAPRSMRRISDVPALVDRFRGQRGYGPPVRVEIDDDVRTGPSQEVQATVYRVVVEGLTNVRRHAAPGCAVTVSVSGSLDGDLVVVVLNDIGTMALSLERPRRAHGGTGLTALRERVAAVGGRLVAGPDGNGQWRLSATIPCWGRGGTRS